MTTYTADIPKPTDNPSFSQDQILQNFQTLNTVYGTSGDHYPWTDTNSTEAAFHAKVTMPGLPTAGPPGNKLPAPLAGQDAIFSLTRNSQTTPFMTRDALVPNAPAPPTPYVNIWPLVPLKAYANFTLSRTLAPPTINDSFNIASAATSNDGSGFVKITLTMSNPMRTDLYGVLALFTGGNTLTYEVVDNLNFIIHGPALGSGQTITAVAIES